MSDDYRLPGASEIVGSDERGGVHYPKVLVEAFDGPSCDAAGRWRISQPHTIFDSKLLHADTQAMVWDEELESGTMATSGPTAAKPFVDFTSTVGTAGVRTRQTFQRFNYQSGKSTVVQITGVLELATVGSFTGCKRRAGLFEDDNGLFFESDHGVPTIVVRTNDTGSPVDTPVAQEDWNVDRFDGQGGARNPSGLKLDITKGQIFIIDFQWLSLGRVRFGLKMNGGVKFVHYHNVANTGIIPWASTPNLPIRYQIITTDDSGVCSMRCICSAVFSEGGVESLGAARYRSTSGAALTTDTENIIYALVGLRLKTTHFGAGIRQIRAQIQIQSATETIEWMLIHGNKSAAITVGGTFTYADLAQSALQTALGALTNTVTGGIIVGGGFANSGGGNNAADSGVGIIDLNVPLGPAIDGTRSELILCVRPIGGVSAADIEGSLSWQEVT